VKAGFVLKSNGPTDIKTGDFVLDLGSIDGRTVHAFIYLFLCMNKSERKKNHVFKSEQSERF